MIPDLENIFQAGTGNEQEKEETGRNELLFL